MLIKTVAQNYQKKESEDPKAESRWVSVILGMPGKQWAEKRDKKWALSGPFALLYKVAKQW